jgi:glucosamine-6-phosphate deaminase
MNYNTASKVEKYFFAQDNYYELNKQLRKIPVITVDNYVELGQLTALRFLEWVCLNPGGVVALPTGKTPEFFIKWMQYYLDNWEKEMNNGILAKIGLDKKLKPDFKSLNFFQLDEFFPIEPEHERAFTYFVKKFYVEGFGFDPKKVRLINTFEFSKAQKEMLGKGIDNVYQVFPDGNIDLSLRTKKPTTGLEILKQKTIRVFDQFCMEYETEIRDLGGIGFFLGGIGPDGHIAFNVKGSSHHTPTRLMDINYETQAAAASDLGGIELVRKKAVITMGLETITYNPDTVAVIIAAGESKAKVVQNAIEKQPNMEYPGTALQKLKNARFFATKSAGIRLTQSVPAILKKAENKEISETYTEKLVIQGALDNDLSLMEVVNGKAEKIKEPNFELAEKLSGKKLTKLAEMAYDNLINRIEKGVGKIENQRFMHTAPHHDDIELAYFPLIHHLVRSAKNDNHFIYCTSGFTAVTNFYVIECFSNLKELIDMGRLQQKMKMKSLAKINNADDDITGYLNGIAAQDPDIQKFYISTRLARLFLNHLKTDKIEELKKFVDEHLAMIQAISPGRKEPKIIHKIKGWLREFEAELAWAHFGTDQEKVQHLSLAFYTDDIFPQYPDYENDVLPVLNLLEEIKPTIITLALDPEGSGPDTHYKTLIALADAIDQYAENHPDLNLHIWGYRNVWSRWHMADVNMIVPVSLNSFAVLHNMFNSCFLSQKSASFPSFELDGTFAELAQKIWVNQHSKLLQLIGREYFYDNPNPMLRRSYGAIYLKDMTYKEFSEHMKPVRRLLKTKETLTG